MVFFGDTLFCEMDELISDCKSTTLTLFVTGYVSTLSGGREVEETKNLPRGRPRKHESKKARVQAFREAHNLRKLTIDVPAISIDAMREFAYWLRQVTRLNDNVDVGKPQIPTLLLASLTDSSATHWQWDYLYGGFQIEVEDTTKDFRSKVEGRFPNSLRDSWWWWWRVEMHGKICAQGYTTSYTPFFALLIAELTIIDYLDNSGPPQEVAGPITKPRRIRKARQINESDVSWAEWRAAAKRESSSTE
jgi:hypothetical protein